MIDIKKISWPLFVIVSKTQIIKQFFFWKIFTVLTTFLQQNVRTFSIKFKWI